MIEHISVPVANMATAKKFYKKALAPLDYRVHMDFKDAVGFMEGGHTSFWIAKEREPRATHVAFRARGKKAVDSFYAAACAAGGRDNGAPGYRDYSPGYYAAFVLDADGNNIEAVWFDARVKRRKKK